MMPKNKKILISVVLISLILGILPASGTQAKAAITHPFDNAALLMISSHIRLDGKVESAVMAGAIHLHSPNKQLMATKSISSSNYIPTRSRR